MHNTKRTFVALGAILCIFLSFSVSYRYFFVHRWSAARRLEDSNWIATSGSWLDRQLCTWFGACGISHLNSAHWVTHAVIPGDLLSGNETSPDTHSFWLDGKENSEDWSEDERAMRIVPKYVLEHAPLVHLYSGEEYWPCDIAEHLHHTRPYFNDEPIGDEKTHLNLSNLDMLREWSRDAFLRSNDNVENQPNWLMGKSNIPSHSRHTPHPDGSEKILSRRDMVSIADEDETMNTIDTSKVFDKLLSESDSDSAIVPVEISDSGQPRDATTESDIIAQTEQQTIHGQRPLNLNTDETPQSNPQKPLQPSRQGGRSGAPVIMITVDKGDGILDAFYFYFYSFNLGNKVLNIRFGNHVGDWEHNAIRFIHGVPKAMFFSQHASGAAYTWDAVEKIDKRPVVYSAKGSHATYPTPGLHKYILPWGLLYDATDHGPLWDPALNLQSYTYDHARDRLRSSALNPKAPVDWFYFMGHWGDRVYPLSDPRQYRIAGELHYVNGPMGPRFKGLGRKEICAGRAPCRPRTSVGGAVLRD